MTTTAARGGYDMNTQYDLPPPYPFSPHQPVSEAVGGPTLIRKISNGCRNDHVPSPASPASSTTSNGSAGAVRSEPPKRLRYWLIDMIESRTIPGLQWENADRTVFRIPWKHAGKNNWREEDCRIFKAWAEHRGKYKKGDKLDAATWKTRLRCALNKLPDIKELKSESNLEGNDPYRVYQLLPEPDKNQEYEIYPRNTWGRESSPPNLHGNVYGPDAYPYRQGCAPDLPMTSSAPPQHVTANGAIDPIVTSHINMTRPMVADPTNQFSLMQVRDAPGSYSVNRLEVAPPTNPCYQGRAEQNPRNHSPVVTQAANQAISYDLHRPNNALNVIGSPNGSDGSEEMVTIDSNPFANFCAPVHHTPIDDISQLPDTTPPPHEMEIYIRYRGASVLGCHVTLAQGCRVHYGNASIQHIARATHDLPNNVFGPEDLQQIELVECDAYATSEKQISLTKHVLNNIKRGLIITYNNGCFYAQRLCQSRVYVLGPESTENQPEKLERNRMLKVFDYRKFCEELRHFAKDGVLKPPETEVKASFGQNWSIKNPIEKNLVTLFMVPRAARFLLTKVQASRNSSSLSYNESILDSRPDSYDRMADQATIESINCVDVLVQQLEDTHSSFFDMLEGSNPPEQPSVQQPSAVSPSQNGYFQQNVLRPVPITGLHDVEMEGVNGF